MAGPAAPQNHRMLSGADLEGLVACPGCDALYRRPILAPGARARCRRCHQVIETRKARVVDRMLATVISMSLLLVASLVFPFLTLSTAGITESVSVIEAVLSLSREGLYVAVIAIALVVGIPLFRCALQIYVLAPLAMGRAPLRHAAQVYRFVLTLRPWAMSEVFTIGVLVAMVKLGDMADLIVGPAFLALFALVFVVAYESIVNCESTLWKLIEPS